MKTMPRLLLAAALVLSLPSCAQRAWIMVPPKMDLANFGRIGMVQFECSEPTLKARATEHFQQLIHEAHPGAQVVNLGSMSNVLSQIQREQIDSQAVRSIANENDLDAVFVGNVEFSSVTPNVGLRISLVELEARGDVIATMTARLVESEGGATVWLRTTEDRVTVASGAVNTDGEAAVDYSDPDGHYSRMLATMASRITGDFRAQYFRKKLKDIPPTYEVTYPDGVAVYVPPQEMPTAR